MGAYAAQIKALREQRDRLVAEMGQIFKAASTESRALAEQEQKDWDAKDREVRELDGSLERLAEQEAREQRAADLRRGGADSGTAGGREPVIVTSEPATYGRGSGNSYFLDQVRCDLNRGDGHGGVVKARERQARHEAELRVEMPKRAARRQREADQAVDRYLSAEDRIGSASPRERRLARQERRAYERFLADGMRVFGQETRAVGTVDGSGGYFVPPLWLVDDYIEYVRAGREFVNAWRNFPLPSGTNSINIPRIVLGAGTGAQVAEGAPLPARDMQDNFVNALVKTVAGQQDVALQLLDQSPINYDEIIFPDLTADYNMQVNGLAMVGAGANNQVGGVYYTGAIGSSSGASAIGYVINDAATAWTASGSTANFLTGAAKLLSNISRNRMRPPTAFSTNPMAWYGLAGTSDSNGRPLVVPEQNGVAFNSVANGGGSPMTEGWVGHMLGLPWQIDPNWPVTFGGTTPPSMGAVSNGHTAPVAGSGGNPDYTPLFAGVMDDLFIWEGDLRTRTLSEVLSGTLQVRFQLYAYIATMVNRYQDASGNVISYGNYNNVGTTGGVLSTAGLLSGF